MHVIWIILLFQAVLQRDRRPESFFFNISDRYSDKNTKPTDNGSDRLFIRAIVVLWCHGPLKRHIPLRWRVSPTSYFSVLQSTAEWAAVLVCPDNALQSSLMSSQSKRLRHEGEGAYFFPYPGTKTVN